MNLTDLADEAYANAKHKGFHSDADGKPKERNIAEALCLIHSEISEALEEIRDNPNPLYRYYRDADGKPEGFLVELADAVIRIGDLVGCVGALDVFEDIVKEKMDFNATRPHMHGKKF